jgi:hypothetical protein
MISNLTKVIFAGVIGAGIGSAVTFLCLNKYYADRADKEIESVKNLYHESSVVKEEVPVEEEKPVIANDNPDDYGSDIFTNFKFGEKYTDYTAYSKSESVLSEIQHPTDDEGESRVFTISSFEYDGDPAYEKRSIYYYVNDDIFLDEDDSSECMAEDGKSLGDYKNLVVDGFDISSLKDSHVDTIFVRNEDVQIDFEIIRMQQYVI